MAFKQCLRPTKGKVISTVVLFLILLVVVGTIGFAVVCPICATGFECPPCRYYLPEPWIIVSLMIILSAIFYIALSYFQSRKS